MAERLDEAQIEILRTWGTRLANHTRAELRAAGKAIVILIAEIERLRFNTERVPRASSAALMETSNSEDEPEPIETMSSHSLGTSLRERLSAVMPNRATFDRNE